MILADLPIRYALFDMDGTLTDTMPFWHAIPKRLVASRGVTLPAEAEAAIAPLGLVKGIEYINSLHLSPEADHFDREDVLDLLAASYSTRSVAKPMVRELLEELRTRGVHMGVATLTPVPLANVCLTLTGLLPYFDFVMGGDDYPEGKNTPRIFLDAAERFGCAPDEMHLFEDSYYSVRTARTLGIPVVGVADAAKAKDREEMLSSCVAFFDDGFALRVK